MEYFCLDKFCCIFGILFLGLYRHVEFDLDVFRRGFARGAFVLHHQKTNKRAEQIYCVHLGYLLDVQLYNVYEDMVPRSRYRNSQRYS